MPGAAKVALVPLVRPKTVSFQVNLYNFIEDELCLERNPEKRIRKYLVNITFKVNKTNTILNYTF